MKLTLIIILLLVLFFAGGYIIRVPKQNNTQPSNPNSNHVAEVGLPAGSVIFSPADIALVPGNDWQQISSGQFTDVQSICLPVLKGEGQNIGSLIQVFSTRTSSDPKAAIDILKKEVEADSNTVKGTFKQEEFVSIYRVPVVHASYDYVSKGSIISKKFRAHVYFVQNKRLKCIAIQYITLRDNDSTRVDQMIHDTLRWN